MKVNESMRKTLQEIVSTLEAKAGSNPCCCQSITGGKVKGRRAVATLARWRGWAAEGVLSAFIF
jgi:hypothetical protein